MIGILKKLFGGKTESSGSMAKERLQLILVYDRVGLSPNILELVKEDVLSAVSKYVEIDEASVDVNLEERGRSFALIADIPILRTKKIPEAKVEKKAVRK